MRVPIESPSCSHPWLDLCVLSRSLRFSKEDKESRSDLDHLRESRIGKTGYVGLKTQVHHVGLGLQFVFTV